MGECICEQCPSWLDCSKDKGKKELVFCFKGKSKCIKVQKGCMCGACPVKAKFKLKNFYFCMKGTEEEQNK
ncbi:MAG: DUF2769 domain-containing protein [Candidatus Nanoarchaeia archaeon]|nr:DUF2769 domain-containing protein [Candidatus Nanoarchaeia archaeon]